MKRPAAGMTLAIVNVVVMRVPSPDDRPQGLGEMSAPLAVPAVLNAIHAATGTRIRTIPLPAEIYVA